MRAIELALSVAVAAALCYTVQGGFNVSDSVHEAVWFDVVACLVLQGMLLAGAGKPARRIASLACYALVSIGAIAIAIAIAPGDNPIADLPQNLFVTVVLFVVVNLLVFALARHRPTCIVLFGLGAFICGLIQFLYTMNMLVATMAFLVFAGMLVAFRAYAETAQRASEAGFPLFGKASLVGALLPLAACALASFVVIGIIMPLDPPHASIKLFNEYLSYEEDHVQTSVVLDEDAEKKLTTSVVDETLEPRTTTDRQVDPASPRTASPDAASEGASKDYLSGDYSDVDLSGMVDNMQALALNPPFPWEAIILCIVLAIVVLLTVPRFIVHRARLQRIASKPAREQVALFYDFYLSRFKKLGMEKPATATPVEYANLFRWRLAPYVGAQEAGSFDHLTALLVQQEYADVEPDAEDIECLHWMYKMFYKRCRKELGLFGYGFKGFTL